jgi:hypothetical protein
MDEGRGRGKGRGFWHGFLKGLMGLMTSTGGHKKFGKLKKERHKDPLKPPMFPVNFRVAFKHFSTLNKTLYLYVHNPPPTVFGFCTCWIYII